MTSILWLRRDLRRRDLPALHAAASAGPVLPLFVIDPQLWSSGGAARRAWLAATLLALRESYDGALCLRHGDPAVVLPELAGKVGSQLVQVSRETTPAGVARDRRVRKALANRGIEWAETGSPYAVGPGLVRNRAGDPYRVFTPFARSWRDYGWPRPAAEPADLRWARVESDEEAWRLVESAAAAAPTALPLAGEEAAWQRWRQFRDEDLADYADLRDRPDLDRSSRLSPYLKLGVLHPRSLLAEAGAGPGADRFVTELAWREFYADVLHHHPGSAWHDLRAELAGLAYADLADPQVAQRVDAWRCGRTGYPLVDAGMRQLLTEGWMHNRVRMVTASFLTKDLHVWWPVGARHFLDHLIDGDVASNGHGWQWVAGTGTDAAPYFRIFNPVTQGQRMDPDGAYVRRYLPELAHLPGSAAHEPWLHPQGYAHGYPRRIIDHAEERREALARLEAVRGRRAGA